MIRGLDIFREYFRDYKDQYVLIGGAACDILFEDAATAFRATKDMDIVLVVESLTPQFGARFWQFIHDGQYENRAKSTGKPQFYRFDKPKASGYPYMLELFSRSDALFDTSEEQARIPLHLGDEISSLSAILLNAEYYAMLIMGKEVMNDIVILPQLYLIPFKAKAWLDLSARRQQGQHVDERDIRKHKNDVARLAALLSGEENCPLPAGIKADMRLFIDQFEKDPVDPKALKLTAISAYDIIRVLRTVYDIE